MGGKVGAASRRATETKDPDGSDSGAKSTAPKASAQNVVALNKTTREGEQRDAAARRPPVLTNTDGDPLVLTTDRKGSPTAANGKCRALRVIFFFEARVHRG
jgi:hypothetical protein